MKLNTKLRKLILEAAFNAKHGHIPSALSIVETIIAIHEIKQENDVFILSKGHGCLAYYAYLCHTGEISEQELFNFGKKQNKLGGHPDRNKIKSVYASTGSLGHGLPIAVGVALANKLNKKMNKVFCLIGDGESNEGTIWESLLIANNLKLTNLVCLVDNNNSQIRSLPTINLFDKFKSFGWSTVEVDGHNVESIKKSLLIETNSPLAIVANTKKGKGISDLENNMFGWHHKAPTQIELDKFLKELNES